MTPMRNVPGAFATDVEGLTGAITLIAAEGETPTGALVAMERTPAGAGRSATVVMSAMELRALSIAAENAARMLDGMCAPAALAAPSSTGTRAISRAIDVGSQGYPSGMPKN